MLLDLYLVFCVVFCRSLFVLFVFVIVLSVLRFVGSNYPFCYLQTPLRLVLWAQPLVIESMRSCKCFSHVSKMPTFTSSLATSVIIQNAMILYFMHIILNLQDTEVFYCNLFIFPRTDLYIHDSINTMFQCTKVTM